MGQQKYQDNPGKSQLREEATDKPGRYRIIRNGRTIAYLNDIAGELSIFRRPSQLYEQGEVLAISAELFALEFSIIRVVLTGKKKRVLNIPRDEYEMVCFEVPIHSDGNVEMLKAVRLSYFLERSPLRGSGNGRKRGETAG